MESAAEGAERSFRAGLSRARGAYLALRDRISRGEFRPGKRFPGEPTLAVELGVSRVTLRHALDRLEAEGLVERRMGSGTYLSARGGGSPVVADLANVLTHLLEMGRRTSVKLLSFAYLAPSPDIRKALQLPEGERVQRSERVRIIDGQPFSYLVSSVPESIGIGWSEDDLARKPLLELLERAGLVADHARQTISATLAGPDVARALGIEPGAALITLTRTVFDAQGRGIEHLLALYRPDLYSFQMDLVRAGHREGRRWRPVAVDGPKSGDNTPPEAAE
jgi:GntR family transcriptional regulator